MRYEHGEQMRMAQEADEQYQVPQEGGICGLRALDQVDLKEYQQKREEELDEYLAQQRMQQKETDKCEQYEVRWFIYLGEGQSNLDPHGGSDPNQKYEVIQSGF